MSAWTFGGCSLGTILQTGWDLLVIGLGVGMVFGGLVGWAVADYRKGGK